MAGPSSFPLREVSPAVPVAGAYCVRHREPLTVRDDVEDTQVRRCASQGRIFPTASRRMFVRKVAQRPARGLGRPCSQAAANMLIFGRTGGASQKWHQSLEWNQKATSKPMPTLRSTLRPTLRPAHRERRWLFGDEWPGTRCGARTRAGTPCKKPAFSGKKDASFTVDEPGRRVANEMAISETGDGRRRLFNKAREHALGSER